MTDDKIALMARKVIVRTLESVYQRRLSHSEYVALINLGLELTNVEFAIQDRFTVCRLEIAGVDQPYFGITKCNPQETYNEERGYEISLNRALHRWISDDLDRLLVAITSAMISKVGKQ